MSYPKVIQPLVIEDEPDVKELYERALRKSGTAAPLFAFSYEEGTRLLQLDQVLHLVILDLRLPRKTAIPPEDSTELGIDLLYKCLGRDEFPIVSLLVISGHLGQTRQTELQTELQDKLHYGRILAKGGDFDELEEEICKAISAVDRYTSIGIHVRSSGAVSYPGICPRDEDLLRRAIAKVPNAIGVDLEWWSAKKFSAAGDANSPWTKVLMGKFLFPGDQPSRPHFFKFYPTDERNSTVASAHAMSSKLQHINVVADESAATCSLLVTEASVRGNTRPTQLGSWLCSELPDIHSLKAVASQIVGQVRSLGACSSNIQPIKRFLWSYHNHERLEREWEKYGEQIASGKVAGSSPIELLRALQSNENHHYFNQQSFVHGDLHAANVAIEVDADGQAQAFIIDAGSTSRNHKLHDLATLEVSLLLHCTLELSEELMDLLYGLSPYEMDSGHSHVANLIVEMRRLELTSDPVENYLFAVLVFDQALIQLGGLAFGISKNRILNPKGAAKLVSHSSRWVERHAPSG